MLWNSHGVLWPRISANQSSTVRTYSQRQDAEWEHFAQTKSCSPACNAFPIRLLSNPPSERNLHSKAPFTTIMIISSHSLYKKVSRHYHWDLMWKSSNDPSRSLVHIIYRNRLRWVTTNASDRVCKPNFWSEWPKFRYTCHCAKPLRKTNDWVAGLSRLLFPIAPVWLFLTCQLVVIAVEHWLFCDSTVVF